MTCEFGIFLKLEGGREGDEFISVLICLLKCIFVDILMKAEV